MTTATRTIADKLTANTEWEERVRESTDDYATAEWKERALKSVAQERGHLESLAEELGPDFEALTVSEAMASPLLSETEKWALRWQYGGQLAHGSFMSALLKAASEADGGNLERLGKGFPDLEKAIRSWRGDQYFVDRLKAILR